MNASQESVVNLLNDNSNNNSKSVHSINSMVKIASGRNSIVVEDLNKNVKLDEQIVVVPYEQIIKEQNRGDGQR